MPSTRTDVAVLYFPITPACSLINNDMKQFIISSETDAIREVEDRVSTFLRFHIWSCNGNCFN